MTFDLSRCRKPLAYKKIDYGEWAVKNGYDKKWDRILFFDPTPIYDMIKIDPYKRIHSIPIEQMFPSIEGVCACGCGIKLSGRQTRWANDMCASFAWDVRSIICNVYQRPGFYISKYFGRKCTDCDLEGEELDHIIPIKHGGGGCWLSNYRWVCKKCHRQKTNKDFGFKQKK